MYTLKIFIRQFIVLSSLILIAGCAIANAQGNSMIKESYSCIPCGQNCDKDVHTASGTCATCQMPLVKTSTINFKTIQPSEVCNYLDKNPQVILLDVRTRQEYDGKSTPNLGRMKNAINVPIQELESKLGQLSAYKDKQIIVYCSLSRRSPRATYILSQNGFKNVMNMAGGMSVMHDKDCKEND